MQRRTDSGSATVPRRTRIVATLGPASRETACLRQLIEAGADVFRLNFSHGTPEEHRRAISDVRRVGAARGAHPGLLADLQGPKIRAGRTPGDQSVTIRAGTRVTLTHRPIVCTERSLCVNHAVAIRALRKGQRILLNDGAVALRVTAIDRRAEIVRAEALNTGDYSSRKGVNLPGTDLAIPALTAQDRRHLRLALNAGVSFVALSFVRRAEDLRPLRVLLRRAGRPVKLIAKIETPEAVARIAEILEVCDGIMVARGDLGIELSPHELPVVQKDLIAAANRRGRLVIVATQMLESMIRQPLPTRAEASDVANAILDGADAVMLSGETSVGRYPVETVATMSRIIRATERSGYYALQPRDLDVPGRPFAQALCEAAAWASRDLQGIPALVFTLSGETAFYLSKIRFAAPIYAFTPAPQTAAQLALAWNVRAFTLPFTRDLPALERAAAALLLERRLVRRGAPVLILTGSTPVRGATDLLRVTRL